MLAADISKISSSQNLVKVLKGVIQMKTLSFSFLKGHKKKFENVLRKLFCLNFETIEILQKTIIWKEKNQSII